MSDFSPRLSLPYILPSQAQKHVTHNEAIKALDALTQLSVLSTTLTEAPATPAAGDCHIIGAGAVGAWAGRSGEIAVFDGDGWSYFAPRQGWRADVADGRYLRFDGALWADAMPLQNLDRLGILTTADSVNRLAVASEAALFTHQGAGHQLKINKLSATDTASLLFQTNWSGRAELGTAGSDEFSIKVSPDGSTFRTALATDAATGGVRFPSGQSYFLDTFIANEGVHGFDIPWANPARILLWLATDTGGHSALVSMTGAAVGASNFAALSAQPAGALNFLTGPLSGTTGPAGAINLAIDASGVTPRMYIENRIGSGATFTLATLGR